MPNPEEMKEIEKKKSRSESKAGQEKAEIRFYRLYKKRACNSHLNFLQKQAVLLRSPFLCYEHITG